MKRFLTTVFAILFTINALAVNVWDGSSEPWTQGTGTKDDPYLIETAANLAYLAEKVNEGYQAQGMEVYRFTYFLMTDDLDLNNINWTPIGNVNMSMEGYYFAGIFDGWYHYIDHLKIQTNADVCGLFAGIGSTAEIKHLSVTNGVITSTGTGAGGIVGAAAGNSRVEQCCFSGTISVSNGGSFCGAGGITSVAAESSRIVACSFSGNITATNNGGFTGAAGAGGIVGIAMDNAGIFSCYNTGSITSSSFMLNVAAGIVAATLQENSVSVNSCYNVGTLNGSTKGGIFGMISPINPTKDEFDISVSNCYYLNTCGGTTNYGTSMTASQMQTEEFKNSLDQNSYIFVMDNGTNNGYPIHALVGVRLNEAEDVTAHSAKLSAEIHKVNLTFVNVIFGCFAQDGSDYHNIEVEQAEHVEVVIDDLLDNTVYQYVIQWRYDEINYTSEGPKYFTTEVDGINDITYSDVKIYPNPTSDFIYIKNMEPQSVSIYTLDGRLVKTVENANVIDVRGLNEGAYLINVDGKVSKVFIEK